MEMNYATDQGGWCYKADVLSQLLQNARAEAVGGLLPFQVLLGATPVEVAGSGGRPATGAEEIGQDLEFLELPNPCWLLSSCSGV